MKQGTAVSIDESDGVPAVRANGTGVRHEVALTGAVTATLTVAVATALAMVITGTWSLAGGGWSVSRQGVLDALNFVGLASAIAMMVS